MLKEWTAAGLGKPSPQDNSLGYSISLTCSPPKSIKDGDLQEIREMFYKRCTFARSIKLCFFFPLLKSNLSENISPENWVGLAKGKSCQRLERGTFSRLLLKKTFVTHSFSLSFNCSICVSVNFPHETSLIEFSISTTAIGILPLAQLKTLKA